jgi:hypothetical protein
LRFVTLGVGAQNSPRFRPAGLLVSHERVRVMLDGGLGARPESTVDAWLVTDERSELIADIRKRARASESEPVAASFRKGNLWLEPRPVVHTNHPTFGYLIGAPGMKAAWAPEFLEFPKWATGIDLMFAEAASWNRPILFRGRVGGHLDVLSVAKAAREAGVRRLVFAHIGRPTIRALDRGEQPPFGEFADDDDIFLLRRQTSG